jgi:hypothetical protein
MRLIGIFFLLTHLFSCSDDSRSGESQDTGPSPAQDTIAPNTDTIAPVQDTFASVQDTFAPSTDTGPATTQDTTEPGQIEACPEPDPNEKLHSIFYHRVQKAISADGVKFTPDSDILLEHASVPDAIIRPDGRTWVYYVNGIAGQHGIFIAELDEDGQFQPFSCVRTDGLFNGNAVDPDVQLLPDGRTRLFYYQGHFTGEGPPPAGAKHPFYSAVSEDGIHFTVEDKILEFDAIATDPTAVQLPGGGWLLAGVADGQIFVAESADGVTFTLTAHVFETGIPELALFEDGAIRLYQSSLDGMMSRVSQDGGQSWQSEGPIGLGGADPSIVHHTNGSVTMYYKTMDPAGHGGNPPPPMMP